MAAPTEPRGMVAVDGRVEVKSPSLQIGWGRHADELSFAVADVSEQVRNVGAVMGAVPRLEDDRLLAADRELDRALLDVNELLPLVLRGLGHASARAVHVDDGHHRVLPVGGEHEDPDPLVRELERPLLAGAHDANERPVRFLQEIGDADSVPVDEPHQATDRNVALPVLDHREKRGRDAGRLGDLGERQRARRAQLTQAPAEISVARVGRHVRSSRRACRSRISASWLTTMRSQRSSGMSAPRQASRVTMLEPSGYPRAAAGTTRAEMRWTSWCGSLPTAKSTASRTASASKRAYVCEPSKREVPPTMPSANGFASQQPSAHDPSREESARKSKAAVGSESQTAVAQ